LVPKYFQRSEICMPPLINKNKLKALILDKLSRHTYWGGKHTDFENLQKGVPQHLKGQMKDAGKELIKEGFLLPKPLTMGYIFRSIHEWQIRYRIS